MIRYVQEQKLYEHAAAMGGRLVSALCKVMDASRVIGDVRGKGLMLGAEVVDRDAERNRSSSPPAFPEMARRIQSEALRCGLILELGGRYGSVVRFLPPLIVTTTQVDEIAALFSNAVHAAANSS